MIGDAGVPAPGRPYPFRCSVRGLLGSGLLKSLFLSLQPQPNRYYTFYDDQMQNWSIIFESEQSSTDFCREVSEQAPPRRRRERLRLTWGRGGGYLCWPLGVFG